MASDRITRRGFLEALGVSAVAAILPGPGAPATVGPNDLSTIQRHEREVSVMHDLVQLNYNFGKAEVEAEKPATKKQSEAFFGRHLHEKLVFRRASGAIVNKEEFLMALASPDNQTEELSSYVMEVTESEEGKTAEVLVLVYLKGKRGGKDAIGAYRNRRLFVKEQNGNWQCLVWFNTRIESP